jgi:predicted TIM-barrel fold metal-dependent hydrolase
MEATWVFAGSQFLTDERTGEKFYQAESGDLICVANFASATLDISANSSATNDDSARAIVSLALTGTMARCPDITFIFSHGGGTLPSIVQRIGNAISGLTPDERAKRLPRGLDYELKRHYYDLASIGAAPAGMAAVLKLWPITQLTYGSDAPFGSTVAIADGITKLGLSEADLKLVQRGNAERLFPRLA